MNKPIVTTMQKILRPENGQTIRTREEVEKFKVFLLLHTGNIKYLEGGDKWHVVDKEVRTETNLPFIVKGVNPDYGNIFITEAELEQAEAQGKIPTNSHEKLVKALLNVINSYNPF